MRVYVTEPYADVGRPAASGAEIDCLAADRVTKSRRDSWVLLFTKFYSWGISRSVILYNGHTTAQFLLYQPQVRLDAVNTGGFHCMRSASIILLFFNFVFSLCCSNLSGMTNLCSPL